MEFIAFGWSAVMGVGSGLSNIVFRLAKSAIVEEVAPDNGTFTRATTAWVKDHESVIREVLSGEARFQGQRRVYNEYVSSEDLTALTNAPKINNVTTATTSELTAINSSYNYFRTGKTYLTNQKLVVRAKVQWISGATDVGFRLDENSGASDDKVVLDLSDGLEHVLSLSITMTTDDSVIFGIDNRSAVIAGVDTGVTKITFTELQLQNKTGASDPTVPDSYVSTGVLSSPYHGANVDGVKYFLTDNGNSVSSNIVVEATGSPITGEIGYFGEIARTNKCTNYNANPTAATNVNIESGTGTLSIASDSTALATAGLDGVCTLGNAFKYVATTDSILIIVGTTANTNKHSFSCWARASGAQAFFQLATTGLGVKEITSNVYEKYTSENITPSGAANALKYDVRAGATLYFILNQLEEGAFSTSEIITEGAAATRNKDELSYPTDNIPVNDCVFSFDWTPTAVQGSPTIYMFESGNATDRIELAIAGATLYFTKRISAAIHSATRGLTPVAGTTYNLKCRLDSVSGVDLWINDIKGINNSNVADVILGSDIVVGAKYDNSQQQTGGIKNFTVHSGSFTDAEVVAL